MRSDAAATSVDDEEVSLLRHREEKSWFRKPWVLALALSTAVVALIATRGDAAPRTGTGAAAPFHARVVRTTTDYGKNADIHTMLWTPSGGFGYDPYDHSEDLALKVAAVTELMQKTIELYYPGRIAHNQQPFEIIFVVTDFPQTNCVNKSKHGLGGHCEVEDWEPIFTFSSTPRDSSVLPTLVGATLITLSKAVQAAMGMPAQRGSTEGWSQVPTFVLGRDVDPEHADEFEFDNLIPKIIWRGSDYPFLGPAFGEEHHRESTCHSVLGRDWISGQCQLQELLKYGDPRDAFRALLDSNKITPRTRAVLMSRLDSTWLDAKFSNVYWLTHPYVVNTSQRAVLGRRFKLDAEGAMSAKELAKYKYQLDLGGWGGTTWTGTIHKMTMPGCLFHHETNMKDSYFEALVPFVHYIPVREDLSDLRERFDQVEADPELCKRVSANANAWVDRFLTRRGLLFHNYEKLAVPLGKVIDKNRVFLKTFHSVHSEL